MGQRPEDYASLVRAHAAKTIGLVVADSGACLDIRDAEVARIRRALKPLTSDDLAGLRLPRSWLLGVILCPDDSVKRLAAWVADRSGADRERVRLFHHPDCDLVSMLSPWYDEGLDDPRADEVRDFASFHRLFGNDLNDQIYADAVGGLT